MDPGFDLEQPAQLLPVTFPESVTAAQFGGFGKVGLSLHVYFIYTGSLLWESSHGSSADGSCSCGLIQ